jgi:hypothetical protein
MKPLKKETSYRLRALGEDVDGTPLFKDFSSVLPLTMEADTLAYVLKMYVVRDWQVARLETIVSGPTLLARIDSHLAKVFPPDSAGSATYYRTIIDTREWITREWTDPTSAKRYEQMSKGE